MSDFRTEYRRNMKYSYMILIADEGKNDADREIALNMWSGRDIPGLLPLRMMPIDDKMSYWYNITGLKSLTDHLGQQKISGELCSLILSSLQRLHETILKYYLEEDHLVLDLDKIYVDETGSELYFCYEPDHDRGIHESLTELSEKLIERIDHQDEMAIAYGYGLYQQLSGESGDLWGEIAHIRKNVSTGNVFDVYREPEEEEIVYTEPIAEVQITGSGTASELSKAFHSFLKKRDDCDTIHIASLAERAKSIFTSIAKGGTRNGQSKIRLFKDG